MKLSALGVCVATATVLASSCAPTDDAQPDADAPELADMQPPPPGCPDNITANPVDRGSWTLRNEPVRWNVLGGGMWGPALVCAYENPYATVVLEMNAPANNPTCLKDFSGFACSSGVTCSPDLTNCSADSQVYFACPDLSAGPATGFQKDGRDFNWPTQTHKATPTDIIYTFERTSWSGGNAGPKGSVTGARLACEYTTSVQGGYVVFIAP